MAWHLLFPDGRGHEHLDRPRAGRPTAREAGAESADGIAGAGPGQFLSHPDRQSQVAFRGRVHHHQGADPVAARQRVPPLTDRVDHGKLPIYFRRARPPLA
jgi:hypothetical protein